MNNRIRQRLQSVFDAPTFRTLARQFAQTDFRISLAVNVAVSETLLEISHKIQAPESTTSVIEQVELASQGELDLSLSTNFEDWVNRGERQLKSFIGNSEQIIEDISETGQLSSSESRRLLQICLAMVLRSIGNPGQERNDLRTELSIFSKTLISMSQRSDITGWFFVNLESYPMLNTKATLRHPGPISHTQFADSTV